MEDILGNQFRNVWFLEQLEHKEVGSLINGVRDKGGVPSGWGGREPEFHGVCCAHKSLPIDSSFLVTYDEKTVYLK